MVVMGLLYLSFENFVLSDFGTATAQKSKSFGRILTGIQVGLIILSMIVTRSTALSLQAKQGLPLGNQVVGWIVLGKNQNTHQTNAN